MASKKSNQRFMMEYNHKYPEIRSSSKSTQHRLCTLCNKHIKVSHGGISDVRAHRDTKQYKDVTKLKKEQMNISIPSVDKMFIRAECQMAVFLVEHNLDLSTSDHFSELVIQLRLSFPYSFAKP